MKNELIRLALQHNVLKFGQFILKSGRQSPYFFNAGLFYHGSVLRYLGECYADTLIHHHVHFSHLFGPAYKGLPLATATAIALAAKGVDTTVTFNRKEIKAHGEGGQVIGAPLTGNTVIIDDVITAGTAFREAKDIIEHHGGTVSAVVTLFDRGERGLGDHSTIFELKQQGIPVYSILTIFDLINYLQQDGKDEQVQQIKQYLEQYGCDSSRCF